MARMSKFDILTKYIPMIQVDCIGEGIDVENIPDKHANYTLQEAMKIVLSEVENKTMHASELADEIYKRRFYLQKNGKKAQYTQIRARCGHYPELFEALPGNYIKLKESVEQ